MVEVVGDMCSKYGVPHPTLVTESGRAVVAYYSVLASKPVNIGPAKCCHCSGVMLSS